MTRIAEGHKRTPVGPVPEDWPVATIGDIASTSSGTTPPRALFDRYYANGSINWAKTLDLHGADIEATDERVTPAALEETSLRMYPAGTVLVAMYGGFNQIGRTGLLRRPAAVNQAISAIQASPTKLCPDYLLAVLNLSVHHWKSVASSSRKDPNITSADVRGFRIAIPPMNEQQAIAAALRDIASLTRSLDDLIAKKRDLKQAAMQQLLTGHTRLPSFDAPWQTAALGTLFVFSGGLSASREQLSSSGHCYLHYGDIHLSAKSYVDVCAEGDQIPRLDVDLREVGPASLLRDGDVVFVDASEDDEGASKHIVVENAGNLPYISGLHTIVAKSRGDHLDKLFKRYCFQSRRVKEQFKFYAVGTKVSGISKSNIVKIELTFPTSREEQRAIATVLTDMDTELARLMEQRDKLLALKEGMMQQLLTGRIRLQ